MNVPAKPVIIEHHIQLDILRKLADSEIPLSFTVLKDEATDNSLFNYHMNKLVAKSWVEKLADGGYVLTKNGARLLQWTNESMHVDIEPRGLICFIVKQDGRYLIVKRKGASKSLLNTYLLPGGMVQYGQQQSETIKQLAQKRFNADIDTKYISTYECIVRSDDGFASHRILYIYELLTPITQLNNDERYEHQWVDENLLLTDAAFTDSPFLVDIVSCLNTGTIEPFMSATFSV